jgi:hypothetical protein
MTQKQAKEMVSNLQNWIDSGEQPLDIVFPWQKPNAKRKTREELVEDAEWLIRFLKRNHIKEGE